jgi:hypothetical protein
MILNFTKKVSLLRCYYLRQDDQRDRYDETTKCFFGFFRKVPTSVNKKLLRLRNTEKSGRPIWRSVSVVYITTLAVTKTIQRLVIG